MVFICRMSCDRPCEIKYVTLLNNQEITWPRRCNTNNDRISGGRHLPACHKCMFVNSDEVTAGSLSV
jgi:hypothetical protein